MRSTQLVHALSGTLPTIGLTITKVGGQAAFFLMLPKLTHSDIAASAFLLFSLSSIVVPTSALGSQFGIIKYTAGKLGSLQETFNTYILGGGILFAASLFSFFFYKINFETSGYLYIFIYLFANYMRLGADSKFQGQSAYNISQLIYIGFWCFKITVIVLIFNTGESLTLNKLIVLELIASMPWIVIIIKYFGSLNLKLGFKYNIQESVLITFAGLSRSAWLEADKLLLPLLVSSQVYVDYSLISRAFSGALSIILSHTANITPRIINSRPSELVEMIYSGKKIVFFSFLAYIAALLINAYMYPGIIQRHPILSIIQAIALPSYLASAVYLDYLFYSEMVKFRLIINIFGAFISVLGVVLFARFEYLWLIPLFLVLSLLISVLLSRVILVSRNIR